jgi:hypothetical protein
MNQRLTELYRSCRTKEALASQDAYTSADVLIGTEVAKFAELLVRECANVAFDEYAKTNGAESGESAILKHFGVKE